IPSVLDVNVPAIRKNLIDPSESGRRQLRSLLPCHLLLLLLRRIEVPQIELLRLRPSATETAQRSRAEIKRCYRCAGGPANVSDVDYVGGMALYRCWICGLYLVEVVQIVEAFNSPRCPHDQVAQWSLSMSCLEPLNNRPRLLSPNSGCHQDLRLRAAKRERDKPRHGVMANTLNVFRNGAVSNCLGFKHKVD